MYENTNHNTEYKISLTSSDSIQDLVHTIDDEKQ